MDRSDVSINWNATNRVNGNYEGQPITQTAAVCPPSTLKSVPVTKLLPLESKNTAGALKSSGAPSLPSKAPAIHVFSTSGSAARSASVIAVRMYCESLLATDETRCGSYGDHLRQETAC